MCSFRASTPRKILLHTLQVTLFELLMRAACCCSTPRCSCSSFEVCVRRLDSVAKPLPHRLQWNGRLFARSTCAS
uniref:Putative secreted protein n=1 Tax=Anopheles darlingi TaxID=43151 RepID=A0A2M4DLS2_ANODA